MTFKKGDKIKVKSSLSVGAEYGKVVFVDGMSKLRGMELEVKEALPQGIYFVYGFPYAFSEEMLVGGKSIDRDEEGKMVIGDPNSKPNENVIVSGNDKSEGGDGNEGESDKEEESDKQEETAKVLEAMGMSIPKREKSKDKSEEKPEEKPSDESEKEKEEKSDEESKSKGKSKGKSKFNGKKNKSDESEEQEDSEAQPDEKEKEEKSDGGGDGEKQEDDKSNKENQSQSKSSGTPPPPPVYWVKHYLEKFVSDADKISKDELDRRTLLQKALELSNIEY